MSTRRSVTEKIHHHIKILKRVLEVKRTIQNCHYEGKIYPKQIVIESIRDDDFYNISTYVLAYFLAQRVENVYVLKDEKDNGVLFHYDSATVQNKKSKKNRNKIGKILKSIINRVLYDNLLNNIKILSYRELLKKEELEKIDQKKNHFEKVNYSQHIDASHQRYFGGRGFDVENQEHLEYAKKSYYNEMVHSAVAQKLVSKYGVNHYITMDGIYVTYGVLVEQLKQLGCTVLIYQMDGFQDRSIFIGEQPAAVNAADDSWYAFLNKNKEDAYYRRGVDFLKQRIVSKEENLTNEEEYFFNEILQRREKYRKTIVLFPNKTWDGAIKERDILFDSMIDWIIQTIDYCTKKGYLVILREHPEHRVEFTDFESSISLLKEKAPYLLSRDNLILINGVKKVNSYKIVENWVDLSVVYNGTLGIEIASMEKPLIFAGLSPYANKQISFEPKDKKEYFEFLDNVGVNSELYNKRKDAFLENIGAVATYQFIENTYYFPLFPKVSDMGKEYDKYWQEWEVEGLDPQTSPKWNRTLNKMLHSTVEGL